MIQLISNEMENITKHTLLISANTGLLILTSQVVFFVLDMFKDEGAKKAIVNDFYLNLGVSICLFCFPIIVFLTFLFLRFNGKPRKGSLTEVFISNISLINTLISFLNIGGFMLILKPFLAVIGSYKYSFYIFSLVGFTIGMICFVYSEIQIKKNIIRDKQDAHSKT